MNAQKLNVTAAGIALQICDVFVPELNKVDSEASLEVLVQILHPFLKSLGKLTNGELKERITGSIFKPMLENNKTVPEDSLMTKQKWLRKKNGIELLTEENFHQEL